MKRGRNKKGLSPVIASVLMILLVIVLAAIIFLWARGFISEQIEKFGKPIGDSCQSVNFNVERIGNDLAVVNNGNININYLDIKLIKGGNSEMRKFNFQINIGESVKKTVTLTMSNGDVPDKIIVYPALVGVSKGGNSNKIFTCMKYGKTL